MRGMRNREGDTLSNLRVEALPGQMGGYVVDPSGAVVANARITITSKDNGATRTAVTDAQGRWLIGGLGSGNFTAKAETPGFKTSVFNLNYDANQPSMYNFPLNVASVSETVEVTAAVATDRDRVGDESVSRQRHWLLDAMAQHGGTFGGPITGPGSESPCERSRHQLDWCCWLPELQIKIPPPPT